MLLVSCSTWHYTDYGRPFDFLKAQKLPQKQYLVIDDDHEVNYDDAEYKSNLIKENKDRPYTLNNIKSLPKEISKSNSDGSKLKHELALNPLNNKLLANKKIVNYISKNIEKKISRKSNTAYYYPSEKIKKQDGDINDFVLLLICLLFALVAVWWVYDFDREFWIDLALYIPLFFIQNALLVILPVTYAIYVCFFAN